MTTGERIRQLRIQHQMTQEELGAKVGVQKAAIYKYENGLIVNLALLSSFDQLNEEGQQKAVDYVDDLVLTGRYKKCAALGLGTKEA